MPPKIKFLYHSITLNLSLMQEMKFNFTDFQKKLARESLFMIKYRVQINKKLSVRIKNKVKKG